MCCLWETREDMEVKHGFATFADKSFLIVGFFLFLFFFSPWAAGRWSSLAASCSALVTACEKDGPIIVAQCGRSSPSTCRGGLGSGLEHCTSSAWPSQWCNVHPLSPGTIQQAAAVRDGSGAVCSCWHLRACLNSIQWDHYNVWNPWCY